MKILVSLPAGRSNLCHGALVSLYRPCRKVWRWCCAELSLDLSGTLITENTSTQKYQGSWDPEAAPLPTPPASPGPVWGTVRFSSPHSFSKAQFSHSQPYSGCLLSDPIPWERLRHGRAGPFFPARFREARGETLSRHDSPAGGPQDPATAPLSTWTIFPLEGASHCLTAV